MYHLYNVVITIVFIIIIVFNTIIISFVFAYRAAAATRSIPQCFICVLSPDLFLSLSLSLLLVYVPLNALLTSREYNNRRRVGCWLLAFKLI